MISTVHISPKQLEVLARCIDAASRTDDGSGVELTIYGSGYVQMERASTAQRWYIGPRGGVISRPPVSPEEGGGGE